MKIIKDFDTILKGYSDYGIIISKALPEGDYKTNNYTVKKLNKLIETYIKTDLETARRLFLIAMESENSSVRSMAAVDSLRMNINLDKSIIVLEEVSKQKDIIGFGAEMALKIYHGKVPGKTL
jgi:hypothetical protein